MISVSRSFCQRCCSCLSGVMLLFWYRTITNCLPFSRHTSELVCISVHKQIWPLCQNTTVNVYQELVTFNSALNLTFCCWLFLFFLLSFSHYICQNLYISIPPFSSITFSLLSSYTLILCFPFVVLTLPDTSKIFSFPSSFCLVFQPFRMKAWKSPSTSCCLTDCLVSTRLHYKPLSTTSIGEKHTNKSPLVYLFMCVCT